MSLSIVMPTCGRRSLAAAVESVTSQLEPGDELIVIGDRLLRDAEAVAARADAHTDGKVVYSEWSAADSVFGNAQRDFGIGFALGSHLCFLDDDDVYVDGALTLIRRVTAELRDAVLVFRARWGAGHHAAGTVLWKDTVWREQNVATPMVVVPKRPGLPRWMDFNHRGVVSDFGWLTAAAAGAPMAWLPEVIATVRPVPHEVPA